MCGVFQDELDSPTRKSTHTVTMKKSDAGHSVTEYGHDSRTDLFQVSSHNHLSLCAVVVIREIIVNILRSNNLKMS